MLFENRIEAVEKWSRNYESAVILPIFFFMKLWHAWIFHENRRGIWPHERIMCTCYFILFFFHFVSIRSFHSSFFVQSIFNRFIALALFVLVFTIQLHGPITQQHSNVVTLIDTAEFVYALDSVFFFHSLHLLWLKRNFLISCATVWV